MKRIAAFLLGSSLLLGVAACDNNAKTSQNAPNSTATAGAEMSKSDMQANKNDATNDIRQKQLNSDVRAREQRNDIAGNQTKRADGDVESEVRDKLEANMPGSQLTVNSKQGAVTVNGSVVNENQLKGIEPLAKKILGVKSVTVSAKVASSKK